MNNHKNVAVLLAVFNGASWIETQVKSIFNQKNVDLTLYVSDDGSTDTSVTYMTSLIHSVDNLILLNKPLSTGSAGQNFFYLIKTVELDNYDYIALSDQDDIWHADKLHNAIAKINEHKADAYSSSVVAFWPDGKEQLINKAQKQRKFDYMFESSGPGCTFVLSKKLALDLQNFLIENENELNDITPHDWLIYAFARSKGYKWFIDKEAYVLYRQHETNVVGANVGIKAKVSRWKQMREGWYKEQALLIGNILGYNLGFPMEALERYRFSDRISLIISFRKLRRRLRDSLVLALYFMINLRK